MSVKIESLLTNLTNEQIERGNEYFSQFHEPITDEYGQKCNACGAYITGTLGIANFPAPGEGTCYDCGHPFRYTHNIPGVGKLDGIPLVYIQRLVTLATMPKILLPV